MIAEHVALVEALKGVPDIRVSTIPGDDVDPPAVALGPPTWTYEAYTPDPTGTSLTAAVVVTKDTRAMERLAALVPLVVAAVHAHSDYAVIRAEPGSWPVGASELPAYLLTIEV